VRTSATGTLSNKGFTLLELVVVLVILAGVTALVLPRLSAMFDGDTRSTARNVVSLLRYLDEQRISVLQISGLGEEQAPDDPFLLRNPLVGSARIADLSTERLGTVTSGTIRIPYGPGGLAEPLLLHLGDQNTRQYTVQALPVNGSVRVAEGNLEILK
jgi:prepilin-type N-terminal cleavage/methylation domain-containing protein